MNMPTLAKRMFAVGLAFACGTALAEEAKLDGTTGGSAIDGWYSYKNAFDGDTATHAGPTNWPSSTGGEYLSLTLEAAKVLTSVRIWTAQTGMLEGCLVQASNGGVDWTTIYTFPSGSCYNNWETFKMDTVAALAPYTHFRFVSPVARGYGDVWENRGTLLAFVNELEFWGADAASTAPQAPAIDFAEVLNGRMNLTLSGLSADAVYIVERQFENESEASVWKTVAYPSSGTATLVGERDSVCAASYKVTAKAPGGLAAEGVTANVPYFNFLTGTASGTAAWDSSSTTFDKAFDGIASTYYGGASGTEAGGETFFVALDLGETKTVTGVRFLPRVDQKDRMRYGQFQISDNADFSDATTMLELPWDAEISYAVSNVTFATSYSGRYVRYYNPKHWQCGDVAEVEFDAAVETPSAPTGVKCALSDVVNQYPVLSWNAADAAVSAVEISSSLRSNGVYTAVATLTDTSLTAWTNETARTTAVGEPVFYKVAFKGTLNGVAFAATSEPVAYRKCRKLTGTVVVDDAGGGTYDGRTRDKSLELAFDGDPATWPDLTDPAKVGIDLGADCYIAFVRVLPRDEYLTRLAGVAAFASSQANLTDGVQFTGAVGTPAEGRYETLASTDGYTRARSVYVAKQAGDESEFIGNVAEVEVWGCRADYARPLMIVVR